MLPVAAAEGAGRLAIVGMRGVEALADIEGLASELLLADGVGLEEVVGVVGVGGGEREAVGDVAGVGGGDGFAHGDGLAEGVGTAGEALECGDPLVGSGEVASQGKVAGGVAGEIVEEVEGPGDDKGAGRAGAGELLDGGVEIEKEAGGDLRSSSKRCWTRTRSARSRGPGGVSRPFRRVKRRRAARRLRTGPGDGGEICRRGRGRWRVGRRRGGGRDGGGGRGLARRREA